MVYGPGRKVDQAGIECVGCAGVLNDTALALEITFVMGARALFLNPCISLCLRLHSPPLPWE